jgi:predicted XRE-type DNA-binding protein
VSSKRKTRRATHELGSRNVYADLGVPDADEMLIKAQLVAKIASIIEENGYTQTKAAEILGLTQPKLSRLLGGHFRGFSERKLMDCLTHLGRDVQIVIRPVTRRRTHGSLSVISL